MYSEQFAVDAADTFSTSLALQPAILSLRHCAADSAPRTLVFFKRNSAAGDDQPLLAWKTVICRPGQVVQVSVPFTQQIGVFGRDGARGALQDVQGGEMLELAAEAGGLPALSHLAANLVAVQRRAGGAAGAEALQVVLYKDGRPLCRHRALGAGETVRFDVLPTMQVAVSSALVQGALVDAAMLAASTRISLLGLRSADLLIEGGPGESCLRMAQQRFS